MVLCISVGGSSPVPFCVGWFVWWEYLTRVLGDVLHPLSVSVPCHLQKTKSKIASSCLHVRLAVKNIEELLKFDFKYLVL